MANDYNEQRPDGSWQHVQPNADGTFTTSPIAASGYVNAGIPSASAPGQVVANGGATTTADQLAGLDSAAGGYWNGNRNDPAAVAAAYKGAASGAGGGVAGMEWTNLGQQQLQAQVAKDAAYQAYLNKVFELKDLPYSRAQIDKMAFDAAMQAADTSGHNLVQGADGKWSQSDTLTLEALTAEASLAGPRNAFQQQAVMNGLNASGLSNAVGMAAGTAQVPGFQAPQAQPEPISFSSLAADTKNAASGQTPVSQFQAPQAQTAAQPQANAQPQAQLPAAQVATPQMAAASSFVAPGASTGPGYAVTDPNAYANALPAPNKLSAPNWLKMGQDTQQFMLGAYAQKGYSENQVNDTLKRLLPQFRAPSAGAVY